MRGHVREGPVAIDVTPMVAARTGIGHWVADLVEALLALDEPPDVIPYVLSRGATEDRIAGLHAVRLPAPASGAVKLWGWVGWPALDGRLGNATVVHGTNFVAPPSRRRAVVVTVHDVTFARFPELCSPAARAAGRVAGRLARRGAWIHTHTDHVAAEVRELFGTNRVRVVAPGVPVLPPAGQGDHQPALPPSPFILALGTLEPRKRHVNLVASFAKVSVAHPEATLVLAGPDGPARGVVDTAIASLPADARDRVVLTGRIDDSTRAALLRNAAVFVYPSLYEGFGLVMLEAMSVGTPVVAARGGGSADWAGGGAVLVDGEPDELAGAIDQVLEDDTLRAQLAARGLARASEYRWEATARGMADLYADAVETASQ